MSTVLPGKPGDATDPEGWTHGRLSIDGVILHYVESGADPGGDRPLVLALHGFPGFWYDWREQFDPLADAGYHVVAPDLRGYNRSSKPRGVEHYRIERLVGDVVGLVEGFERSSAHLLGHDWGGTIAWETAIRLPALVDRLAICNAPHPEAYRRALRSFDQFSRSLYAFFFQLPWLPERVLRSRDYEGIERILTGSSTDDAFSEADLRRYRNAIARRGALTAALNYYRATGRIALRDCLRGRGSRRGERRADVDAPTLVCWGERDPGLSPRLVDGLEAWVSGLRVERFPEARHWIQLEEPERVNELLRDFLARDESRVPSGEQAAR